MKIAVNFSFAYLEGAVNLTDSDYDSLELSQFKFCLFACFCHCDLQVTRDWSSKDKDVCCVCMHAMHVQLSSGSIGCVMQVSFIFFYASRRI